MDVISGRKTGGKITGTITVNGRPKDDDSFRKLVGYVEQNDIHDPFTTVREGLLFAARLVRGCRWLRASVDGLSPSSLRVVSSPLSVHACGDECVRVFVVMVVMVCGSD
jgi:hypothetical protein